MPISITELWKIPLIYSLDLEPEGKFVLYSSNATGIPHLYVVPLKKANAKPRQITSGNDAVMFGFISPVGDLVAYIQDKDGNELHHVFVTSKEGNATRQLSKTAHRTWDVGWHPNGKELTRSFVSKKSSSFEAFNLETGESYILKEQETPVFDVSYSKNGKWIATTEWGGGKDPKNQQVLVFNKEDPTEVLRYKIKDGSKEMFPSWSSDDKKIAFLSDSGGRNQVVVQDFQGNEQIFLDLEDEEEAIGQRVAWSPKNDKIYYIVSKHSRSSVYEHSLDGERTRLPFPEGTILLFRASKDASIRIALHSSMASPYGIYLHKANTSASNIITPRDYKVNLKLLAKPKSVWYKSFDGLKIHGWYLPAGSGAPPYPAVVWAHGGPWWQVFDSWSPYLQSISQSGFSVFAPNFRGSTGYGADFRNMDLSDPGGKDLEDVAYGAQWLSQQAEIDGSKVAIMGGSYGGFMTLIALTKKPEVFQAGVAIVPVADWIEMYERSDSAFRKFMEELFKGAPSEKADLYRERSPITHVRQIKAPVLIMHGRNDSRCPIQPVEKFVANLKEMGHRYEFRVQEDEGHGTARVNTTIREVETAVEYLKRILS